MIAEIVEAIEDKSNTAPAAKPEPRSKKKLTFHNGQYRASIGYEEKPDGSRKPRVWMLGKDIREARLRERRIRVNWESLVNFVKAKGCKKTDAVWVPEFMNISRLDADAGMIHVKEAFKQVADFNELAADGGNVTSELPLTLTPAPASRFTKASGIDADAPDRIEGTLTLTGAIKAYAVYLDSQKASKDRAPSNISRRKTSCQHFLRFVGDQPYVPAADPAAPKEPAKQEAFIAKKFAVNSPTAARPITDITYDQISTFTANMKNRAVSQFAPDTIKISVEHMNDFFGWLEDSRQWVPTCNYSRLLKVNKSKITTMSEAKKLQSGQDTFDIKELKLIYEAATKDTLRGNRYELYLLLGLNLFSTQQQLADILVEDIDLTSDQPAICFIRGKTRHLNRGKGIQGRYPLWPETARVLEEHLNNNPPTDEFAFSTEDGQRLVRYDGGKTGQDKVDSVRSCWERLLKGAGATRDGTGAVTWLGFKHLRKTAADNLKTLAGGGAAGEYFQQLALAHAKQSVAGKHYSGDDSEDADFQKLSVLIMRLRTEVFAEMFE